MLMRRPEFMGLVIVVLTISGAVAMEVGRARTVPESAAVSNPPRSPSKESTSSQTTDSAFSITSVRKVSGQDGIERLVSTTQRYQRSDGVSKLVHTFYTPEGAARRVETSFGFLGAGTFRLDEARRRLVFTWPQVDDRPENLEQYLREHARFVREESVQGINTIVWRQAGAVEAEFTEEYRAPSLGGLLVKTVKFARRGREIFEPTAIELGEPAQNVFAELLNYPVDYLSFERRAAEADGRNAPDVALLMREALARMRQIRP